MKIEFVWLLINDVDAKAFNTPEELVAFLKKTSLCADHDHFCSIREEFDDFHASGEWFFCGTDHKEYRIYREKLLTEEVS